MHILIAQVVEVVSRKTKIESEATGANRFLWRPPL